MSSSCWSGFCIASDCDGVNHVDATGYTWSEERRGTYDCAACWFRMEEATADEAETEHFQTQDHEPDWATPEPPGPPKWVDVQDWLDEHRPKSTTEAPE